MLLLFQFQLQYCEESGAMSKWPPVLQRLHKCQHKRHRDHSLRGLPRNRPLQATEESGQVHRAEDRQVHEARLRVDGSSR